MIFGVLIGIFVGIASAGYMFIQPLADRDKMISEQKEESLQVHNENKDLRAENEDLRFDLSSQIEKENAKDEIVEKIKMTINDFMTKEDKLNKIKELADDYQSIN